MSISDERVIFLAQLLADLAASESARRDAAKQALLADARSASTILRFVDDSSTGALFVSLDETPIKVSLEALKGTSGRLVVVTKLVKGPLEAPDLSKCLSVSTVVGGSPLKSLQSSIAAVYLPLLGQDRDGAKLLQDIASTIGGGGPSTASLDPNAVPVHSIASINDEFERWSTLAGRDTGDAGRVVEVLQPLKAAVDRTQPGSPVTQDDLLEVVDVADQVFQDVSGMTCTGHPAYDAAHMEHAMYLVAAHLQAGIARFTAATPVFEGPFEEVHPVLQGALTVVQELDRAFQGLSAYFVTTIHNWPGHPPKLAFVARLKQRLHDVLHLREVLQEVSMLTGATIAPADALAAFAPMRQGYLSVPSNGDPVWDAAKMDFDGRIGPYEERLRSQLRSLLTELYVPALTAAGAADGRMQPAEVVREVSGLRHILSRKGVLSALEREVCGLLTGMSAFLSASTADLQQRIRDASSNPIDVLAATSQVMARIQQVRAVTQGIVPASVEEGALAEAAAALRSTIAGMLKDVQQRQEDLLADWVGKTRDRLEDVKQKGFRQLMDFDGEGRLRTAFNQEMLRLLKQARQIIGLGLTVPKDVMRALEQVRTVTRRGMALMQVVNFYNEVSNSIADCHKRMLVEQAKQFEAVILNPTDAAGNPLLWDNTVGLDNYLKRLTAAMGDFRARHERILHFHRRIEGVVRGLLDADLVADRGRWEGTVRAVQAEMRYLESEFDAKAPQPWRLHWDMQLKKVLGTLYARGLETYHRSAPRAEIRLVFQQRRLLFDPPIEQVRQEHVRQLAAFVSLPASTAGVSAFAKEGARFFASVAEGPEVADKVAALYERAEGIFADLAREQARLAEWVAMGMVGDVEAFVDEHCKDIEQVKPNLQAVSQVQREAGKLIKAQVEIGCYTLSLASVREAVERQCKELQEAVIGSQTRQARQERLEAEGHLTRGLALVSTEATSIQDIGEKKKGAPQLAEASREAQRLLARVRERNRLIAEISQSAKAQMEQVDVSDLEQRAEEFESARQRHDHDLEDQRKRLVGVVEGRKREFVDRVRALHGAWAAARPREGAAVDKAQIFCTLDEVAEQAAAAATDARALQADCEAGGVEGIDLEEVERLAAEVAEERTAWQRYEDFCKERDALFKTPWMAVRERARNEIEDFLHKWKRALGARGLAGRGVVDRTIQDDLERYEAINPHLKFIQGFAWDEGHWARLFKMIGMPRQDLMRVTLLDFLERTDKLTACADEIRAMDARAQAEAGLRKALAELKDWGFQRTFSLLEHDIASQGKTTHLIREWKDLMTEVGDMQALVGSLKQSPFFADSGIKDEVVSWDARLSELSGALLQLNDIQRRWVYLEPIFSRGALPAEQARFSKVDRDFQALMATVARDPNVKSLADRPGLNASLKAMATQLEHCQKALMEFLEERRSLFPRFYFIGDDDLLEILSQSRNPQVIQTHLKKLFAGIFSVVLESGSISAMCSSDAERVPLATPVATSDKVEGWLSDLETAVRASLQGILRATTQDPAGKGLRAGLGAQDFDAMPSQVLCLSEMVRFTSKCEVALQSGALDALRSELRGHLDQYTASDYDGQPVMQLKIKALVLDTIHHLDVVDRLREAGAKGVHEWEWHKQLRFYLRPGGDCDVHMASSKLEYTFEYQGNAPKLVYTPLTDKCFLTLTQAIKLGYGGNPYGPAGTGKTESVKALGQYLARQVLVFNCDEEFDFKSMGRIFMGLLKCGAWGCFDEFNRLEPEVLSAVSQQIQLIQGALKQGQRQMAFMGREVPVNRNAGIFVTLNPAGKGYGGRSQLPDNLKQLFRSVAMTVPDNELIAEVLLLSEGFHHAKAMARQVVTLFDVSRQLLSRQRHYDWGLRALKTSLGIAGRILREGRRGPQALSQAEEAAVVIQAVRVTKLPTLTAADTERFASLLEVQFQGVRATDMRDEGMQGAISQAMAGMSLAEDPAQVQKVLQLHMATLQRIGVIIVGPSGSGKSTLWQVLEQAYKILDRPLRVHKMNPKAIDRKQLLGSLDLDTREWTDGVLTSAARRVVAEDPSVRSWIICDGDVDPVWIESLNSVLDDNRLLTLPNGERIQLGSGNVNFVFECHTLQWASPATVSRCGMIFLSEEARDIAKDVNKWLADLERTGHGNADALRPLCAEYLPRVFQEACAVESAVETTAIGRLWAGLSHVTHATTRAAFLRGLAAGFGANMLPADRERFRAKVAQIGGEPGLARDAPPGSLAEAMGTEDDVPVEAAPGEPPLVPTGSMRALAAVLAPWLQNGEPVVLVGPSGCGKTLLVTRLAQMLPGPTRVARVACSAHSGAAMVITKLKQICGRPKVRGAGKLLAPQDGGRVVLLIKDVNLPQPDTFGTVQLVAFLQQLITYRGYYDEDEGLEFVSLDRVQIVCTMTPQGSVGRHRLSTRLTANMRVAYVDYPSPDELGEVFAAAMEPVAHHVQQSGGGAVPPATLADALVQAYSDACSTFSANDHRQYAFTPRHLMDWGLGLLQYDMGSAAAAAQAVFYEGCRVFADRMASDADRANMEALLAARVRGAFRGAMLPAPGQGSVFTLAGEPVASSPVLVAVPAEDYQSQVSDRLRLFHREVLEAPLVLFPAFLARLAAIERALARPGGAALLVGEAGVGRRTSALLVAHMLRMDVVSPRMVKAYGAKHFAQDLKDALERSGTRGEPTLLLVDDHQLVEDGFLETLNAWLMSGEVVGLLTKEDRERMVAPLEKEAAAGEDADALFLARARRNLRVCLCMDPGGPDFGRRCEASPALFGRCTVVWMQDWGDGGTRAVAEHVLSEAAAATGGDPREMAAAAVELCRGAAAPPGVSPRKVDALVRCYVRVASAKRAELARQQEHLRAGVGKLKEASSTVDKLSSEAEEQKVRLKAAQEEADKALEKITRTMEEANARKREVEKLSEKLATDEVEIQRRKGGVEAELAEVQPQIDEARAAVGGIKKEHLSEIKSMKAPPDAIRDVLESVMKLMGFRDTTWSSMRNFLGQTGFKERIVNFDAHEINAATRLDVGQLIASRPGSFRPADIARVSRAAAPLAAWVQANLSYSVVLEKVAPLESTLAGLTQQHSRALQQREAAQREIDALESSIAGLKEEYARKMGQAEQLKISLRRAEDTLQRAQGLLGALVGERDRWDSQVSAMQRDLASLPRSALLAAAFCVFLPGEPEDTRADRLADWVAAVGDGPGWSFTRFMSSERQVLGWKAEGLPSDALSVENAVAIVSSAQAPLIVDPSLQGAAWIEAHLKGKGLAVKVTAPHAKNFTNSLELAARFGEALVVRDVDALEPILVPLLRRDLYKQGPRSVVLVGDKLIDYAPAFQLFLVTRNPEPHLPPQVQALVTEVNFSVTRAGLEAQLLGLTIQNEKPQMEKQLKELLRAEEEMKVQLSDLEKSLLDTLASSTGNILENESLSKTLNDTKHKAKIVEDALQESSLTQAHLAEERSTYAPVASLGSTVYFAVRDLRTINHVYQISLPAILALFQRVLREDETDPEAREARVASLQKHMIQEVYAYVSRALFNEDRLTFAMHLARVLARRKVDAKAGAVLSRSLSLRGSQKLISLDSEWDVFLLRAPPTAPATSVQVPQWVRPEAHKAYHSLLSALPSLATQYRLADSGAWAEWASHPTPESAWPDVGIKWASAGFHQMLLIQAIRPDRLQSMMSQFACRVMGVPSTEPPPTSLADLVRGEASSHEPLLFLTTPGADPSQELADLTLSVVGVGNYTEVAMGQGQSDIALKLLREFAAEGRWLCLKNLHLVVGWLPELEKEIFLLQPHANFRLFLTSEPHRSFPTSLLEHCLKVTFEAPPGMRNNLLRTLGGWRQQLDIKPNESVKGRLLFTLAWFHAVVQERRRYVPIGWSKFYEFSGADLRSGADIIDQAAAHSDVEWPFLHGLLETAVYGGNVEMGPDFSILSNYLHFLFSDATVGAKQVASQALPGTKGLTVPSSGTIGDMANAVAQLPDDDVPDLFSLPANVQRTAQQQRSSFVIQQMRTMDVSTQAGTTFDLERWRHKLGTVIKAWEALLRGDQALQAMTSRAAPASAVESPKSPMESMTALEFANATALVRAISDAMRSLDGVLHKGKLITAETQAIGSQLMADKVPSKWDELWEGPMDPLRYMTSVARKASAVCKWRDLALQGQLLQASQLDLSSMFEPTSFLNALRQDTALAHGVSMDDLCLVSSWEASRLPSPKRPVRLSGLLISAAAFDGAQLRDVAPDAPTVAAVPEVTVAWVPTSAPLPYKSHLSVPVYTDGSRSKSVCYLQLPVTDEAAKRKWILAGTALFLEE